MKHSLILVGGFGFVGRNIIKEAEAKRYSDQLSLAVIDDLSNAAPGHEHMKLLTCLEKYQSETASKFIKGLGSAPNTIVFLAGETRVAESLTRPLDFIKANIDDPAAFVMNNVKEQDHFILISTAGALFDGTTTVGNDTKLNPKNFYGASKASEELILQKLVEAQGATYSVIRMTNVYGLYSEKKKSAVHAFIRSALNNESITINGDGKQSRDFIFSRDVASGILTHAYRFLKNDTYHTINTIGYGSSVNLWDIISIIERHGETKIDYRQVEAKALIATEPREVIADKKDAQVLLPYGTTSLSDGIKQTYEYYQSQGPEVTR